MFNLFGKKNVEDPIAEIFSDLTGNQKMSVINLLLVIGVCDNPRGNHDVEIKCLNSYVQILAQRSDKCLAYLESNGHGRITDDLRSLSKSQREFLVVAAWEMITCDGDPNEVEVQVTLEMFEKIGISNEDFILTVKKTKKLMDLFLGK